MRYEVSFEVKRNDFPKIARALPSMADDAVAFTVLALVAAADPNTPVDTGNLKNNKTIDAGGGGKPGYVHWHAPYAGFVHNGTRYLPARPFIADAVAQVWPLFQRAMMEALRAEG